MRAFRKLNADFNLENNYIYSLNTDTIPVEKELIVKYAILLDFNINTWYALVDVRFIKVL